ncbi:RRP15-like protein [Myripristis murdjan]|uniref:RRP15-like protein n=1 Tax=Myripristis murdjan TaxID=586833 RepID=A0A668AMX9_9TELE|nr:RRP15-like protein [Myripristis murdjan]
MMAAVAETHVESPPEVSGDDDEPQYDDSNDEGDSDGGSDGEGSDDQGSDGGEDDRDSNERTDGEEAEDEDEGEDGNANAGWAEAMAKILGKKTPESKSTILLKNKELDKIKEKEKQEQLEKKKQIDKKRTWEMMCRQKPDVVKDREAERNLQRIATRGVVQLFNAVRKHQKTINDKVKAVGGSERKKAKILSSVSKKEFIDVLRRTEGGSTVAIKSEKETAAAAEEKPAWSVLRDDFMMGASMKDWDKESDGEDGEPETQGGVEDSDSD